MLNDHNLSLRAYGLLEWLRKQKAAPTLGDITVLFPDTPEVVEGALAELREAGLVIDQVTAAAK